MQSGESSELASFLSGNLSALAATPEELERAREVTPPAFPDNKLLPDELHHKTNQLSRLIYRYYIPQDQLDVESYKPHIVFFKAVCDALKALSRIDEYEVAFTTKFNNITQNEQLGRVFNIHVTLVKDHIKQLKNAYQTNHAHKQVIKNYIDELAIFLSQGIQQAYPVEVERNHEILKMNRSKLYGIQTQLDRQCSSIKVEIPDPEQVLPLSEEMKEHIRCIDIAVEQIKELRHTVPVAALIPKEDKLVSLSSEVDAFNDYLQCELDRVKIQVLAARINIVHLAYMNELENGLGISETIIPERWIQEGINDCEQIKQITSTAEFKPIVANLKAARQAYLAFNLFYVTYGAYENRFNKNGANFKNNQYYGYAEKLGQKFNLVYNDQLVAFINSHIDRIRFNLNNKKYDAARAILKKFLKDKREKQSQEPSAIDKLLTSLLVEFANHFIDYTELEDILNAGKHLLADRKKFVTEKDRLFNVIDAYLKMLTPEGFEFIQSKDPLGAIVEVPQIILFHLFKMARKFGFEFKAKSVNEKTLNDQIAMDLLKQASKLLDILAKLQEIRAIYFSKDQHQEIINILSGFAARISPKYKQKVLNIISFYKVDGCMLDSVVGNLITELCSLQEEKQVQIERSLTLVSSFSSSSAAGSASSSFNSPPCAIPASSSQALSMQSLFASPTEQKKSKKAKKKKVGIENLPHVEDASYEVKASDSIYLKKMGSDIQQQAELALRELQEESESLIRQAQQNMSDLREKLPQFLITYVAPQISSGNESGVRKSEQPIATTEAELKAQQKAQHEILYEKYIAVGRLFQSTEYRVDTMKSIIDAYEEMIGLSKLNDAHFIRILAQVELIDSLIIETNLLIKSVEKQLSPNKCVWLLNGDSKKINHHIKCNLFKIDSLMNEVYGLISEFGKSENAQSIADAIIQVRVKIEILTTQHQKSHDNYQKWVAHQLRQSQEESRRVRLLIEERGKTWETKKAKEDQSPYAKRRDQLWIIICELDNLKKSYKSHHQAGPVAAASGSVPSLRCSSA